MGGHGRTLADWRKSGVDRRDAGLWGLDVGLICNDLGAA